MIYRQSRLLLLIPRLMNNGKVFEGTKEATLTGTWDIGKKILYTLTLPAGAEELTFTAQADGWTNEDPQPSPIEPNK